MADLNLTDTPPFNVNGLSLSASRNPISFTFETDTIGTSNFAYAWVHLSGPAVAPDIEFEFNGRIYTAKDDPAYGEFLTTTSHSLLQVCQSLVLTLRDDPNNYQYEFEVSTGGAFTPMLFVRARQNGSAYDIALTLGAGFTLIANISGSDQYRGQLLEDYKIWVDLNHNPAFAFAQYLGTVPTTVSGNQILATYDLKFDPGNSHVFDVHGVVDTQVDYEYPDMTVGIHRQLSPIKAFFIEYGESYIPVGMENPVKNIIGRSNVFYAVNSALATLAENDLQDYTKRSPLQKFLTEQPVSRSIRTTDISWLSFIWYSPSVGQRWCALHVIATFYDGTSTVVGNVQTTQMLPGYNTIRVDPESWGMASFEITQGQLVRGYDIYLIEATNAGLTGNSKFSELRHFELDRLCEGNSPIQFAWLETIGGWSGFSFFGESITEIDRSYGTFDRGRKRAGFTTQDQMVTVLEVDYSHSTTCHSGTVDVETFRWLRDSLLKSIAVFVVSGSQMFPVVITGHQAKSGTNDLTFSLAITFRLSAPQNTLRG